MVEELFFETENEHIILLLGDAYKINEAGLVFPCSLSVGSLEVIHLLPTLVRNGESHSGVGDD